MAVAAVMWSDRASRISRKLLILSAVVGATSGIFYLAFVRPTHIIDRLLERAEPERALPGRDDPTPGVEIALRDELRFSPLNESSAVTDHERLAVISRWTRELYPYFNAFMLACVLDPPAERIARDLEGSTQVETAANIRSWAAKNLLQTQSMEQFEDMPGRDPWGALNVFEPAYKKLLPSEMLAMSLYTGKMTGKCCSLVALLTSLFVLEGARPEDVVVFRLRSHNIGLVRYAGKSYVLSNQKVSALEDSPDQMFWVDRTRFKGFFAYSLAMMKPLGITTDILASPADLATYAASAAGAADILSTGALPSAAFEDADELRSVVFGPTADGRLGRITSLARYAYQSLYVREPKAYLEASVRAPTARELARKTRTPAKMIAWIRANVAYGSIFEDHAERIMTADQVIVFRRGTYKDQAMLFSALLARNGFSPAIHITRNDAYVSFGPSLTRVSTWQSVDHVEGTVEMEIGPD